jgi:hypothetical protein
MSVTSSISIPPTRDARDKWLHRQPCVFGQWHRAQCEWHDSEIQVHSSQVHGSRASSAIRIIVVGAGLSGIAAVKLFQDTFKDSAVELVIYEKNHYVTGTWLENRYPRFITLCRIFFSF